MSVVEKKPDVVAELKLVDAPHPDERWEGQWTFRDQDPTNDYDLHATARLQFVAGLIEGRGLMTYEGERVFDLDVSGVTADVELTFTTFVVGEDGVNGALSCTATLSDGRSRMSGTFTHPCLNTIGCEPDCQGGWGEFEMQRIVDAG